jgi:hypothetical protein
MSTIDETTVPACMHPSCTAADFYVLLASPVLFKVLSGMRELSQRQLVFSKPFDTGDKITVFLSIGDAPPMFRVVQKEGEITVFHELTNKWFTKSKNPATILKVMGKPKERAARVRLQKDQVALYETLNRPPGKVADVWAVHVRERVEQLQKLVAMSTVPRVDDVSLVWPAACALFDPAANVNTTPLRMIYDRAVARYKENLDALVHWASHPRLMVVMDNYWSGAGAWLQWGRFTCNMPSITDITNLNGTSRLLEWTPESHGYAATKFSDLTPKDAEHIRASNAMLQMSMGTLGDTFATDVDRFHLPFLANIRTAPMFSGVTGGAVWTLSGMAQIRMSPILMTIL